MELDMCQEIDYELFERERIKPRFPTRGVRRLAPCIYPELLVIALNAGSNDPFYWWLEPVYKKRKRWFDFGRNGYGNYRVRIG